MADEPLRQHSHPRLLATDDMSIEVSLESFPDIAELEAVWTALESRSDCTYYFSWGWVGTWLRATRRLTSVGVLVARSAGAVVGLALAGRRSKGRFSRRGLYLQGTRGALGRITFEHGGFLAARECEREVQRAFIRFLGAQVASGRLGVAVVGWVPADHLEHAAAPGAQVVARWREPNYSVELDKVRELGDYTSLLGARTRKSMRRTKRLYEQRGPVEIRVAGSVVEAHAFLDRLMELHQATWRARGWPGNFADPAVVAFHRELLGGRFDDDEIQLVRVTAGGREVGYQYNFVYRDRVIAYDMGLVYDIEQPDLQPGRLCDWMVVQHAAAEGFATYDLLTGDTQYKRSLATQSRDLVWLLVRRDRPLDRLDERMRRAFVSSLRGSLVHKVQSRLRTAVVTLRRTSR